jgi:signal transduction histidine kinase/DNA-binding response OmpR family regulator
VKETIVVVDDEEHARNAVARILKSNGYTVHALPGGQEAIDFASRQPFDLLLTDFRMPGMDGLTTVRAVRRINPQVVAIIMTANNSVDLAVQSLNLGVHGFVIKPFTIHELLTTINQTLERQQLIRENTKMRALVDIFGATEALILAKADSHHLPQKTMELAIRESKSNEAVLFLVEENGFNTPVLELAAVALCPDVTKGEVSYSEPQMYEITHANNVRKIKDIAHFAIETKGNVFMVDDDVVTIGVDRMIPAQKNNCLLAVPLQVQGRIVGVLCIRRNNTDSTFSEVILQTTAIIASQGAIAIENGRLVTKLARIEAQREADLLRSEFVATVSHELRTPLTSIKGYTTTLLRTDVAWKEKIGHEYLGIIDEECDKLLELIDNILEVAKLEAGALRIHPEPVLIRGVLERAISEAQARHPSAKITLDLPSDDELPFVLASPKRLTQVLHNLIQNAIKYSPQPARIAIVLQKDFIHPDASLPMIRISVADKGIGISSEELGKIFERFYRIDRGATRKTEGTGLGLAICRGIIEAHKGQIWAESSGAGEGSTFYFTLPTVKLSEDTLYE